MAIKWKSPKRMEDGKFAEAKFNPHKDFYAVGTDGKKSYVGTFKDATLTEARREARSWAEREGLRLELPQVVNTFE